MTTQIVRDLDIDTLSLALGNHSQTKREMCMLEAVAYISGEDWTDTPKCVCPTITSFLRVWNDNLNNEDRQKLKPYITKLVGTNLGDDVALARSYMVADWYVRVFVPAWLRCANQAEVEADDLESLSEIVDSSSLKEAIDLLTEANLQMANPVHRRQPWKHYDSPVIKSVRLAIWSAGGSAVKFALRKVMWSDVEAADQFGDLEALESLAFTAVKLATKSLSNLEIEEKLKPTSNMLQASAFRLLDRMIAFR